MKIRIFKNDKGQASFSASLSEEQITQLVCSSFGCEFKDGKFTNDVSEVTDETEAKEETDKKESAALMDQVTAIYIECRKCLDLCRAYAEQLTSSIKEKDGN